MFFHLFDPHSFHGVIEKTIYDEVLNLQRNLDALRKTNHTRLDIVPEFVLCSSFKGHFSEEHLVEGDAECPEICLFVVDVGS